MHPIRSIGQRLTLLLLLLLGAGGGVARAQSDSTRPAADTLVLAANIDTVATESGYTMTKSPLVATALSIVPGAGQIYNEDYFKSALFIGAGGFFAFQAIRQHIFFTERAAEVDALPLDDSTGTREVLRQQREFNRDNRDVNIAYFVAVQILSMIDAYVGAHLFDFDVDNSEDGLSSRLYLDPRRAGIGVMMRW